MPSYGQSVPNVSGWLDGEGKTQLVAQPLMIAAVDYDAKNKFGPRWVHTLDVIATGERYLAGFGDNAVRSQIAQSLQQAIRTSGEPVGPVVLYAIPTDVAGNSPTWAFRDAEPDEIAEAEAARQTLMAENSAVPEALPGETLAKAGAKAGK